VVEFYLKLKPILRIITYLTCICWEIDNFVTKSDMFRRFVRIFLKNYRVTMTTALDTSCSKIQWFCQQGEGFCMHVFSSISIFIFHCNFLFGPPSTGAPGQIAPSTPLGVLDTTCSYDYL
jgi:hypothetical protein